MTKIMNLLAYVISYSQKYDYYIFLLIRRKIPIRKFCNKEKRLQNTSTQGYSFQTSCASILQSPSNQLLSDVSPKMTFWNLVVCTSIIF